MPVTASPSIEMICEQLLMMSRLVQRALDRSLKALFTADMLLARTVIEEDKVINSHEIDIDNAVYNMFALGMRDLPIESLRLILSVQKINSILERIGDHAVNISESTDLLAAQARKSELYELPTMAQQCSDVLRDTLLSFFQRDQTLAQEVLARDDEIDRLNVAIAADVKARVLTGPDPLSFETGSEIIRVCRNLERIADLASNIAEETSFITDGRIVKHHAE